MKNKMVSLAGVGLVSISILMAGITFSTMAEHHHLSLTHNHVVGIESLGETVVQSEYDVVDEVIKT